MAECVQVAFRHVGIEDWQRYVVVDPALLRPAEVDLLIGNPAKARRRLGWRPEVSFEGLMKLMVESDLGWRRRARSRSRARPREPGDHEEGRGTSRWPRPLPVALGAEGVSSPGRPGCRFSERIRYSSSSSLTSVPAYLA